jgi:hypothetical protein
MSDFVKPKGLSVSGDNDALKAYLKSMDKAYFDAHIAVPARCLFNSDAKFTSKQHLAYLTPEVIKQQHWYMSLESYHKGDFVAHVAGMLAVEKTTAFGSWSSTETIVLNRLLFVLQESTAKSTLPQSFLKTLFNGCCYYVGCPWKCGCLRKYRHDLYWALLILHLLDIVHYLLPLRHLSCRSSFFATIGCVVVLATPSTVYNLSYSARDSGKSRGL